MKKFLSALAEQLYEEWVEELSNICVVFPNKRAGVFFLEYLNQQIDQPIISPDIQTISSFFRKYSSRIEADPQTLLIELYKSYKKNTQKAESFEEFYFWGKIILSDFNDVDNQLVNGKDLFRNLASLKGIENTFDYLTPEQIASIRQFWSSFNPAEKSHEQKNFLSIWEILFPVYKEFKKNLISKNWATPGMIAREMAEKIHHEEFELGFKKIIFVGFNALTKAEEVVFNHLKEKKKADFYWDYDHYYLENQFHEAGFFIRKNIKKFGGKTLALSYDKLVKEPKNIEIISCQSEVAQTKIISHLFDEKGLRAYDDTVVVFANESLMMPCLYSLPEKIEGFNVSMGFPFKHSLVFEWFNLLTELQKNCKVENGKLYFYYKNLLSLLNHPYFLMDGKNKKIIKEIQKKNATFIAQKEIPENEICNKIFVKVKTLKDAAAYFSEAFNFVFKNIEKLFDNQSVKKINMEFVFYANKVVRRLEQILLDSKVNMGLDAYFSLLKKMLDEVTVPFSGDPLKGLQLMGLLETRLLDFRQVIFLSTSDEHLPKKYQSSSFIPLSLRKAFGLTTIEQQNAIYAYYFYRLLQRAEKVSILYNSVADGLQTGEPSRFILQMKYDPLFEIKEKILLSSNAVLQRKNISIEKNPEMLRKLNEYLDGTKRLSPSAINNYLDCGLQFYFKYIASIKEPEEIDEIMDPILFGNLFHESAQLLYQPFISKEIDKKTLQNLKKTDHIEHIVKKAFGKIVFGNSTGKRISGYNLLIFDMLKKYLLQLITYDLQFAPFNISGIEKRILMDFPVEINGKIRMVGLKGFIDRIDLKDRQLRVIDYKTGTEEISFTDMDALFEVNGKKRNHSALQTLLYCLMLDDELKSNKTIFPAIYFLTKLRDKKSQPGILMGESRKKVPIENYKFLKTELIGQLESLLKKIFSLQTGFEQTDDENVCRNCAYKIICLKE